MTETTLTPFRPGTAPDTEPEPELPESAGNRRAVLALLGLGALLVLAVAAYFLLFSGGGDDTSSSTPPATTGGTSTTTQPQPAASAPAAQKPAKLPKISQKNFGTDPFKALVQQPTTGSTDTTTGTTTGSTTGSSTTTGSTTDTGSTTGSGTGTTSNPGASQSYRFQVTKVASDNSWVTVKVDGKTFSKLKAGEVFDKIFKVRFIGGSVNSFQIGDEVFNVAGTKAVEISG